MLTKKKPIPLTVLPALHKKCLFFPFGTYKQSKTLLLSRNLILIPLP